VDPLPDFVAPMLAQLGSEPFDDREYVFEIKWDGIRGLAFTEGGSYRLRGRSRSDLAPRYPELAFLAELEPGLVLDGEIVALKDGRPDFYHGMQRTHARNEHTVRRLAREVPVSYVVFDVLYRRGESLMELPLSERTEVLGEVLGAVEEPRLARSEGIVGEGIALYREAEQRELEGVMAKRLASRYRPGRRTESWIKLKPRRTMPCAILGYLAEGDDLRSLVLGADQEGELVCVGRVASTGSQGLRAELLEALRAHAQPEPLIDCGMDASWIGPGLFCTVSFLERTESGLRAPVFVDWIR